MNFDKYTNRLPWPDRKDPNGDSLRVAYKAEEARTNDLFKADLLAECGLTDHPKADIFFSKCWEMGHGSGLREVFIIAQDLEDLLK